jgi:hypothetical protein
MTRSGNTTNIVAFEDMLKSREHITSAMPIRVVTGQYPNGLFGSFDTFEPSKQTIAGNSIFTCCSPSCLLSCNSSRWASAPVFLNNVARLMSVLAPGGSLDFHFC